MAAYVTRREGIIVMLRSLDAVVLGSRGSGRDGFYSLQYGPLCTDAFRELLSLLERMKQVEPVARKHVVWRYVYAETRPVKLRFTTVRRQGKTVNYRFSLPAHSELTPLAAGGNAAAPHISDDWATVLLTRWPDWVDESQVNTGVEWLAGSFRGVPGLPSELVAA